MMPPCVRALTVLAAALFLGAAAPLHADEWTLIDVKARLAPDARVTVVETHDIVLETSGRTRSTPSASAPTRPSASPR